MNDIFNAKRFVLLFKKTLLEKPVQMFGFTGLSLAVVFILYIVAKAFWGFQAAQNLSFIWGLPLGSCLLASLAFGYFSNNASGSFYLTLPASHFEKWLCAFLISCVIYPIIFLIFYRIVDSSFVAIFHHGLNPTSPFYKEQYESVNIFDFTSLFAWRIYSNLFMVTSVTLIGSLYFNKMPLIKVAITVCILFFGIVSLNLLLAKMFFGNIVETFPFTQVIIPVGKEEASIVMPDRINKIFSYSLGYFIPAILYILAFTRLREKEF